jgi:hypothetical protein
MTETEVMLRRTLGDLIRGIKRECEEIRLYLARPEPNVLAPLDRILILEGMASKADKVLHGTPGD